MPRFLLTQEIAYHVCRVRDNSKLLKKAEGFHQHPVLDDLALDNPVDGEHPYLHFLAARGNSQPRALVRAFHQQLHHDTIAFTQRVFDTKTEIWETGDTARNMLFDRLRAARHCSNRHARPQLMCYT